MRSFQSASTRWLGAERAERARESLVRQNAFARRIGLRLLTFVVTLFLASLALQIAYTAALYLVDSGVLRSRRVEEEP